MTCKHDWFCCLHIPIFFEGHATLELIKTCRKCRAERFEKVDIKDRGVVDAVVAAMENTDYGKDR